MSHFAVEVSIRAIAAEGDHCPQCFPPYDVVGGVDLAVGIEVTDEAIEPCDRQLRVSADVIFALNG
ncbi:MAG TPA: hypothetical protein VHK01_01530 [Lacipirellulaceae bacterium]|nr:hypothetical protein [Lacipirellulaceae bacterium]